MPLFHAVGFYSALVTTLSPNGTYFVHSAFDPAVAVDMIKAHKLSYILGRPPISTRCLRCRASTPAT